MYRSAFLLLLSCCGLPAAATTVFKCQGADRRVIYQDHPCARDQRQQALQLPEAPLPAPPPTAPAAAPASPPPVAQAAPPPAAPGAPLPLMYRCIRATDGKTYLSRQGDPAPYLAPLGMLGVIQRPLSQVYGPTHGRAGISAPEANHGRVTSDLVANNYVWVQDACDKLGPEETCRALRDAYEENARKLQRAFKSDRPPLQRRDDELRAQLQQC
ncbi:hypothetical protein ASG87_10590 [Frateuria sp. Soil773]|uniref:DUF4124 domain-containing protein n=1 Tax=Frateuria sp. Soil773 TaxID=1736407 RepID=UPI0006FB27F5|nr:DUF4124 domain-containing protein [Frateuria sp. Soil773]KRF01943.1 hypothetical protein ASG87_10590 [Frateuria sp. Soil773]